MHRYLAIHPLEEHAAEGEWDARLTLLAKSAHQVGVRPLETFYSAERGTAYTLYDAPDAQAIEKLYADAGLARPTDVFPAQRVFTELLARPRRERFA